MSRDQGVPLQLRAVLAAQDKSGVACKIWDLPSESSYLWETGALPEQGCRFGWVTTRLQVLQPEHEGTVGVLGARAPAS